MSNDMHSASEHHTDTLASSQQIMADFCKPLARRTRERHVKELDALRKNLKENGKEVGNLTSDAAHWSSITSDDIVHHLRDLGEKGYQITSIRDKFYTIRTYARLAMQAGFFSIEHFNRLGNIKLGEILNKLDKQDRPSLSKKKLEPLLLTEEQVYQLLAQPDTSRGRTDALLIALPLQVGLWPREISALNRRSIDLEKGTLTFYDYHFGEEQVYKLDDSTLEIAARYLRDPSPYEALFIGNRKESTTELRLTDRAINTRVRILGNQIGLQGLSPHDCHLYWERKYRKPVNDQSESSFGHLSGNDDSLSVNPSVPRKVRPDLFNRRMFEAALLDQGVQDALISQMISDIRLLVPLLIQQVGEEVFRKIAVEHRSALIPGSATEIWEQTVHHLVIWAKNEMGQYFPPNKPDGPVSETKE